MAEYTVAPDYTLYKLPDSVPDTIGALLEPLEVGFHTIRRSGLQIGDTIAIIGAGTIGISAFWSAKAAGASKVFVIEISKVRRDRVKALGATEVIDPNEVNPVEAIRELTHGMGADISIDCVGLPNTAPVVVELARRGGTVVLVGMYPTPIPNFDLFGLLSTEKVMLGSWAYVREAQVIIDLLASGSINPSELITGKVPLEHGVEKGFKELIHNPEKHLKILLKP
jgi:(R,R)-butanediol dehydrogenase/meso-butanediol dehydrogenase/diacetyl reductase